VKILDSILRARSKQIAREGLQKNRLRTAEVKMTAGKHSNLTGPHGHFPPGS
jgi:PHP family Zn ribbon phosphoesterase